MPFIGTDLETITNYCYKYACVFLPQRLFFLIISSLFVTVGILLYSVMCQWKRQLLELNVVLGSSNCRVHQKTYQHFCTLHLLEVSQIQLKLPIVTTYTPRFNT